MLARQLPYLDGARVILAARWDAQIPEDDPDVGTFALIESETDDLPIGAQREHWSPDALENKESDMRRAEEWARRTAEDEARRLVQRFGDFTRPRITSPALDLVQRRAFFDNYADVVEALAAPAVQFGIRSTCPCCGYPTLGARAQYEICFLCSWEDDGHDDHDADDVHRGPNRGYSLSRARDNFVRFGVMYEPENDTRIGGFDSEAERSIKARVVSAFERMRLSPPSEHEHLWNDVRLGERELNRLLKIRIRTTD